MGREFLPQVGDNWNTYTQTDRVLTENGFTKNQLGKLFGLSKDEIIEGKASYVFQIYRKLTDSLNPLKDMERRRLLNILNYNLGELRKLLKVRK